jgi:hypothetical protein
LVKVAVVQWQQSRPEELRTGSAEHRALEHFEEIYLAVGLPVVPCGVPDDALFDAPATH